MLIYFKRKEYYSFQRKMKYDKCKKNNYRTYNDMLLRN